MKERPIIFSAPMIRAILDGRKTQTRRSVKDQDSVSDVAGGGVEPVVWWPRGFDLLPCPYGEPGDRLWVRETFVIEDTSDYWRWGIDEPPSDRPIKWLEDDEFGRRPLIPHYRATEPEPNIVSMDSCDAGDDRTRWSPAIFMPRWASRLTLEITAVRVERLQEIREADAQAEGVRKRCSDPDCLGCGASTYREPFAALWDSINAKRAPWESNPWVWVIEFRKVLWQALTIRT